MYLHFPTLVKALRLTFSRTHFSLRHALNVAGLLSLFFMLRGFVAVGRLLDRLFFPRYRKQRLVVPLYIIGNPRSGTTFLHRLLSLDDQFSYTKLYHTIFPAIVFYKLIGALGRLDEKMGHPLRRVVGWVDKKGFGGWEGIHRTRLDEAEEDEQLFVYTLLTPVIALLFPFLDEFQYATYVDDLPEKERSRLMAYYRECLQRHLYATGPEKTLLTKNTTMTGRLRATYETFPDLRVVHMVRHPYHAVPSLLSMYDVPWDTLAPQTRDFEAHRILARQYCDYYKYRMALRRELPQDQVIEIRYEDLIADPQGTVTKIYAHFGLEMGAPYKALLREETEKARRYKSKHCYSLEAYGLSNELIYREMEEVFEAYGFEP